MQGVRERQTRCVLTVTRHGLPEWSQLHSGPKSHPTSSGKGATSTITNLQIPDRQLISDGGEEERVTNRLPGGYGLNVASPSSQRYTVFV